MWKMKVNKLIKLLILLSVEIKFGSAETLEDAIYICCGVAKTGNVGKVVSFVPGVGKVYKSPCVEELKEKSEGMSIDVDKFHTWCTTFKTQGVSMSAALVVANTENPWSQEMQDKVLLVTEKRGCGPTYFMTYREDEKMELYYLFSLLQNELYEFWKKFNNKYGLDKDVMCACLKYNDECLEFFWNFFYHRPYYECTNTLVSDMLDAFSHGRSRQEKGMHLVKKFSAPTRYAHSIVHNICNRVVLSSPDTWQNKQMKMLLFRVRDLDWTASAYVHTLQIPKKHIELFTANNDPYAETLDNDKWNMDAFILYVHTGCYLIKNQRLDATDTDVYPFGTDLKRCISNIAYFSDLASNFYKFNIAHGFELLKYNEFEKKIIRQDTTNDLRFSKLVYEGMVWLKKELMKAIVNKYPDSDANDILSQMYTADDFKLGVRALLSLVLNFKRVDQVHAGLNAIIEQIVSIPIYSDVTEQEKTDTLKRIMFYPRNPADKTKYLNALTDEDTKIITVRSTFGYQPPETTQNYDKKNWGKVVFVAIYTTCIRLKSSYIQQDQFLVELSSCIDDVATFKEKNASDLFCGLFKRNPYFGEFDIAIKDFFQKNIADLNT